MRHFNFYLWNLFLLLAFIALHCPRVSPYDSSQISQINMSIFYKEKFILKIQHSVSSCTCIYIFIYNVKVILHTVPWYIIYSFIYKIFCWFKVYILCVNFLAAVFFLGQYVMLYLAEKMSNDMCLICICPRLSNDMFMSWLIGVPVGSFHWKIQHDNILSTPPVESRNTFKLPGVCCV